MVAIKECALPAADVKDKPTLPSDLQRVRLLVEKAVLGDPESFGELYDLYADRIYRHCYYRTRNEVEAEDLTALCFLMLIRLSEITRIWGGHLSFGLSQLPTIFW